jgi:hypothetical protein
MFYEAEPMNRACPHHFTLVATLALIGLSGCEHVGVFEPFREVECLERAQVSLKNAIVAAEADGGRALDADYRQEEEMGCLRGIPGVYDVTLLRNGKIEVVSVDARTANVGPHEEANVMNLLLGGGARFEGSPADMARMVPRMPIAMSRAIDVAEGQGGKAISAWIEAKDGKSGFTVKVVEKGRVRVTWIDGG